LPQSDGDWGNFLLIFLHRLDTFEGFSLSFLNYLYKYTLKFQQNPEIIVISYIKIGKNLNILEEVDNLYTNSELCTKIRSNI